MTTFPKILWLKGCVAFAIPFLTALGAALSPYVGDGSAQPTMVGWIVLICAPLVAGFSALSSFLSTSFADHKAALLAAGNGITNEPKIK